MIRIIRAFLDFFQLEESTVSSIPSLFDVLNYNPIKDESDSETELGIRFIKNESSDTYDAIPTDGMVFSWHITSLEESGEQHYLCQVINITLLL